MGNESTKIAALLRPATRSMHATLEDSILTLLRDGRGQMTRLDLARALGKGVNCVTAPVKSLLDAKLIVEAERIRQPETGNLAWALKLRGE